MKYQVSLNGKQFSGRRKGPWKAQSDRRRPAPRHLRSAPVRSSTRTRSSACRRRDCWQRSALAPF